MLFFFFFLQLDSLEKLNRLLDACIRLGVETSPVIIDDLGIIPLFSWYHEVKANQSSPLNIVSDYSLC